MSVVPVRCFLRWCAAALAVSVSVSASAQTLRIVSWNVNADTTDAVNFNNATSTQVQTVLAAIGAEKLADGSEPIDVLALEELKGVAGNGISPTLATLVTDLDAAYPGSNYAYDMTADPTDGPTDTGNGPSGLIYNTKTVVDIAATVVAAASSSSDPRAPMFISTSITTRLTAAPQKWISVTMNP